MKEISIKIYYEEIFGILGSNGAGKTTIMRILAGLVNPTAGFVYINGMNLSDNHE